MCKRVSCNVFKALVLAILLPFYANAQDTDSTTVAQPDSAATAPEKPAAKPDASGVTSAFENTFSIITLVLPHNSLRNSKTLHNWPFIAFSVPAWALNFNIQKNMGPLLTLKGSSGGNLGFEGINLRAGVSLELIHLLELGVQGLGGTAINYGETATFMGVYDPEKRDYRQDVTFTEYLYGINYHGALTLPLLTFLPKSDWTKIILKGTAEYTYSGYTGAEDKQVWKAGGQDMVNGFRYKYGGTLIYMLPFERVPMFMFAATVSAFKHAYDFDDTYKDYNPGFKTVSLTPMASVKISEKWNGMLMAVVSRDRVFENRRYPTTEELLQKQVDSEWDLRMVMFIASRKF